MRDLDDIRPFDLLEIQHFYEVYKDLEPGKSVDSETRWPDRTVVEAEITAAHLRLAEPEPRLSQART